MSIADSRSNFGAPLSIYQAIVDHQRNADGGPTATSWSGCGTGDRSFIKEFALLVKDGQFLPMPLVKIEPLNVRVISTYRAEPDGYALAGAIVFNEKRLRASPMPPSWPSC